MLFSYYIKLCKKFASINRFKKRALDLLANNKLLLFINENNIEVFFKKIIKAFKSDFFNSLNIFIKII